MKSRTSFFNGAVLKKDLTRFAPVWGLYTLGVLLFVWMQMNSFHMDADDTVIMLTNLMNAGAVVNFVYALIVASVLFGDLYVPKMCNALHAMPLRREGWFLTHSLAALLFSLIPNLLAFASTAPVVQERWMVALLTLAASTMQYLFFFGLAVLCVFLAGNRLGMAACYGILNFGAWLLYGLIELFYLPRLYGVKLSTRWFERFTPVGQLVEQWLCEYKFSGNHVYITNWNSEGWAYLGILTALGLVFWGLGLLLYRRRHLERAGDLLAVRAVVPVFLLIVTLAGGMLFYLISDLFTGHGQELFLLIGMAVGFFVSRMLLERRAQVFTPKSIGCYGAVAAVMVLSLWVTSMDPMGLVTKVPPMDRVEGACLNPTGIWWNEPVYMEEPEQIAEINRLHRQLFTDSAQVPKDQWGYYGKDVRISVGYTLRNGSRLDREYHVNPSSPAGQELKAYLSSPSVVFGNRDPAQLRKEVREVCLDMPMGEEWVHGTDFLPREKIPGLIDAILLDCQEGNMAQSEMFYVDLDQQTADTFQAVGIGHMDFVLEDGTWSLHFYQNAVHTYAYLKSCMQ